MSFDNIVQLLEGVRPYKSSLPSIVSSVRAQCPCCGGSSSKLNVSLLEDGTVLLKCFGGCTFPQIMCAIGLDVSQYFPVLTKHTGNPTRKINRIKGWDWWSMVSALDHAYAILMKQHIDLSSHLPIHSPARLIMATAAGEVKELAQMFKNGRKGEQA